MLSKTLLTAAAATLFASANAHLFIQTPQPIPGTAPKDPLDPSGSNFPCHGVDVSGMEGGTKMAAGSMQPLTFDLGGGANTAVHGGGSCQVSITYETDAAKLKQPSSWKVIYSVMGGCPAFAAGNLATSTDCTSGSENECMNTFKFKVPEEVKNGNAVLAWTWFNNVGNREMYMNCAAVTFSGGKDKIDTLPNMFVANLAAVDSCPTTESMNVQFPNPGKYVTTMETPAGAQKTFALAVPTGAGCSGGGDAPAPTQLPAPQLPASTPAARAVLLLQPPLLPLPPPRLRLLPLSLLLQLPPPLPLRLLPQAPLGLAVTAPPAAPGIGVRAAAERVSFSASFLFSPLLISCIYIASHSFASPNTPFPTLRE
ncbi:lytic polysaccharide monooxygenase [Aulographum hederae CBS 113979]|uniref:Lytic polysaccharide monooxygenase n=1 Tax=Aulographum hederae CBS 113979 TaxID=1176131 RepID=A0A6G1GZZ5_9PEZI|nr:lytic polysaccharide monooxygenase [Aulographum hederae CBS 113979]